MDFSCIGQALHYLQTDRVVKLLHDLNVEALIHNPVFLGGMGAVAVIALFMRWKVLLVTVLSVVGFAGLVAYTLQQGTDITGMQSGNHLFVFIVSGVAIILAVIYLLFIRGD